MADRCMTLGCARERHESAVVKSPVLAITRGNWHHMLARRRGSVFDLFFDGQRVAKLTDSRGF